MKKFLILIALLASAHIVSAQTVCFPSRGCTGIGSVAPGDIGKSIRILDDSPFTYELYTPSSGSGGGSGNVATSSAETSGRIPFWTSTSGTPATLSGGVAGFTFDGLNKFTVTYGSTTGFSTSYASSTLGYFGTLFLPSLSQGFAYIGSNGKVNSVATSTALAEYVPYTGATANVDIGAGNDLTAGQLATSGNGLTLHNDGDIYFYSDVGTTQTGFIGLTANSQYAFDDDGIMGILDFSGLASSDKTFTFPNQSGTVCIVGVACDGSGSGSSAFEIATTSTIAVPQLAYFTKTGGMTTLGGVATSSLAVGASLLTSGTLGSQIGGTASSLSINTANTNTWSVLQNFNYSSSTIYSSFQNSSTTLGLFGTAGVGTSSPSARFAVTGSGTGTGRLLALANSSNADRFVITDAGRVGINTNPTNDIFEINGLGANACTTLYKNKVTQPGQSASLCNFGATGSFLSTAGSTVAGSGLVISTDAGFALKVANDGFGTTTIFGLNITGQATSTADVGFNITTGCYAVGGVCVGGGGSGTSDGYGFTTDTYSGNTVQSTTTTLWLKDITPFSLIASSTFATQASSTMLTNSGNTYLSQLTSALVLTGSDGLAAEYTGAGCTNQVIEDLSVLGAPTCVSINNGYWSGTDLSVANGGTGLSTFGGTNTVLYTTSADTLASEAAFTYVASTNTLTADTVVGGVQGLFATTTNPLGSPLVSFSTTKPQISLSEGAGQLQWTLRNNGGVLDFATTTVQGLATSSPSALQLNGNAGSFGLFVGTTTNSGVTGLAVAGTGAWSGLASESGSGDVMCVKSNGSIVLDSSPTTACSGASSRTVKHSIKSLDADKSLETILGLNPVSFVYNKEYKAKDQTTHLGFIAEDVESLDARLVEHGDVLGLKYVEFVPLTVGAIQKLDEKINNLSIGKITKSAHDNWQWGAILVMFGYIVYLHRRIKKNER